MSQFAGLQIGTNKPARMYLMNPYTGVKLTEQGVPEGGTPRVAYIDLLHDDHPEMQKAEREILNARPKTAGVPLETEFFEAEMLLRMAKRTKAWCLLTLEGQVIDVELNEQNATELYKELPWVYDQVLAFSRGRANFKSS